MHATSEEVADAIEVTRAGSPDGSGCAWLEEARWWRAFEEGREGVQSSGHGHEDARTRSGAQAQGLKPQMAGVKGKSGRKKGYQHDPRTIERIRASINAKLAIDTLHELCTDGGQHDGVRATAAATLLRKVLPDLNATDITSGGEQVMVERVMFKKPTI
jgi:hypothetical protein